LVFARFRAASAVVDWRRAFFKAASISVVLITSGVLPAVSH
jgi:hypothetical protein